MIPVGTIVGVSDGFGVGLFEGVCVGETEIYIDYK